MMKQIQNNHQKYILPLATRRGGWGVRLFVFALCFGLLAPSLSAKEKKADKPKTEQTKTADKKAKKQAKSPFKNKRLYTLTCRRGTVVMNAGGTALASTKSRSDAPKADMQFAIIEHEGALYLYSPTAKKFLAADGTFVDGRGAAIAFDRSHADGKYRYMLTTTADGGATLHVNMNDADLVVIDAWDTPDDGNRWSIKSAGKFDPKEALELAQKEVQKPRPEPKDTGLFNVVKKENDWFFEIPDSLLGRDFLATTRYTSTPASSGQFGGEMTNQQTVYFQTAPNNQLLLRVRLFVNVSDSTQAINKAITVSNENPIIASFRLESHKDGLYRIKVSDFLNDDSPTTGLPRYIKSEYGITNPQGNLCFIEGIKTFPQNTEVRMTKTYNANSYSLPSARSTGKVTFGINLSFVLLPAEPMTPRYYDPRVGFFTHGYNSYNDGQQRVRAKRFISRWRLEPKPEDVERMRQGELVEPVKPIVYYIDPATPKQWRQYLIDGVNDWQKAFEKAGFKNAIRAEEWPENADSLGMSMEDARYSVIRYLASPIPNAYGPHVSDPRTGEILESHICWYHNVMSLVHDWYMVQASSIDEAARKMHYDEHLMGQLIRFVSSHEVGHTLGLRHNFGSSSTVPVEKLRDRAWVAEHGHTPSIMDYARFNYVAQPEDGMTENEIFPRINDYDCWAIQWGYTPMPDATDEDEDYRALQTLFERENVAGNPRLWWGDGETNQDDPRRQTEDLGDDAVKASEYGIKNLKREITQLPAWTYDSEDIYNENLESMYAQIRAQFLRYNGHVINNIGGTLENFRTIDQPGDVYRPQPRAKQLEALRYVERNILTEPTWLRDLPYARRLAADPNDLTAIVARTGIARLLNRVGYLNDLYKANEFLSDLNRLVMRDAAGSNLSPYRQTLQRTYVTGLIERLNGSDKYRPYILQALRQLQRQLPATGPAHAAALRDQIDRALVIK